MNDPRYHLALGEAVALLARLNAAELETFLKHVRPLIKEREEREAATGSADPRARGKRREPFRLVGT